MKKYIGVKLIEAVPMTSAEFNALNGRTAREGEDPNALGYLVTYPDGYKGWCPKKQFEEAYWGVEQNSIITHESVENFIDTYISSKLGAKTAVVHATCLTGFEMTETAACVNPDNYDQEIGNAIALDKIKNRLWGHLGFVLQWAKYGLKNGIHF